MAEDQLLRRFLRTVRVATATALAEYELSRAGLAAAPVVFRALAAKGADGWRFPEAGLAADDGLILATIRRDASDKPVELTLQAQGAAGLDAWAGRMVRVSFSSVGPDVEAGFTAAGRAVIDLSGLGLEEDDLMQFDLQGMDANQ